MTVSLGPLTLRRPGVGARALCRGARIRRAHLAVSIPITVWIEVLRSLTRVVSP